MTFEYPLKWNKNILRTEQTKRSKFGSRSAFFAGKELVRELKLLGAKDIIITSNLRIKQDGTFHAVQGYVEDPGICVYLKLNGADKCFACDKWDIAADNVWALKLNVEAIRGLERWGGSNFMDGLFTGFKALPDPANAITMGPDYFYNCGSEEELRTKFIELSKEMHPDKGGNAEEFKEMKRQYDQRAE